MSTDDNNKIIWNRAKKTDSGIKPVSTKKAPANLPGTDTDQSNNIDFNRSNNSNDNHVEMSTQAAAHKAVRTKNEPSSSAADALKAEIEEALSSENTPKFDPQQNIVQARSEAAIDLEASENEIDDVLSQSVQIKSNTPDPQMEEFISNISPEKQAAQDNHDDMVSSLRDGIQKDFKEEVSLNQEEIGKESTIPSDAGMGGTYYSDLSKAMSANTPSTMSELIRKSRFQDAEKKVLSPRSTKNMIFIVGAILLLLVSVGILFYFFSRSEEQVEFITESRVESLVYSNLDTGINVTGLDALPIKQAIREVIDTKIPENTVNQIYYVEQSENNLVKRLGIKDVFDKTDNQTPTSIYTSINNNFAHGVYRSDKNYPFVLLTTDSYDRTLASLQEWEPSMIDDLSVYLDLPEEASDRSLLKTGFEDDLIQNKNVRVARFIPREADSRGLLDILTGKAKSEQNSDSGEPEPVPLDSLQSSPIEKTDAQQEKISWIGSLKRYVTNQLPVAYAQQGKTITGTIVDGTTGEPLPFAHMGIDGTDLGTESNIDGVFSLYVPPGSQSMSISYVGFEDITLSINGTTTNYNIQLQSGIDLEEVVITAKAPTGGAANNQSIGSSFGSLSSSNLICYRSIKQCTNVFTGGAVSADQFGQPNISCYDQLLNSSGDQSYGPEFANKPGYKCINALTGNGAIQQSSAIGQISVTDHICFDPLSGSRLSNQQQQALSSLSSPAGVCFESYECLRYACYLGNLEVASTREGEPGVSCRKTNERVSYNSPYQKQCRQFTDILSLSNINEATLCFDNENRYIPSPSSHVGLTCLDPLSRSKKLCLSKSGKVYDPNAPDEQEFTSSICFQPLEGATGANTVNNQCGDLTVQQVQAKMAAAAFRLQKLAVLGRIVGLSEADTSNINDVAAYLNEIALGNVLQVDAARQVALYLSRLEDIIERMDPNVEITSGPNDKISFFEGARNVIDTVKCGLGIANNLQWETLQQIEIIQPIAAGQISPQVTSIQQTLALIGLMDPISVNSKLDLVTQDAISQFQLANGIPISGVIDADTVAALNEILHGHSQLFGIDGLINNYFNEETELDIDAGNNLTIGAYNNDVQNLQILLYAEGYGVSKIDGLYTEETCLAVQTYQQDNDLTPAEPISCTVSKETVVSLNSLIQGKNYLGSGFEKNSQGYLVGSGVLEDVLGPGVINFNVQDADADSLKEGDVVLMYLFLDDSTVLITRERFLINEIIRRRALDDIFNK